jgi:hypothetical protein
MLLENMVIAVHGGLDPIDDQLCLSVSVEPGKQEGQRALRQFPNRETCAPKLPNELPIWRRKRIGVVDAAPNSRVYRVSS